MNKWYSKWILIIRDTIIKSTNMCFLYQGYDYNFFCIPKLILLRKGNKIIIKIIDLLLLVTVFLLVFHYFVNNCICLHKLKYVTKKKYSLVQNCFLTNCQIDNERPLKTSTNFDWPWAPIFTPIDNEQINYFHLFIPLHRNWKQ